MNPKLYKIGMIFKGSKTSPSDEDKQFKGPEAYQVSDKNRFKGRDVETQQLLYMVEHSDWCVCYARSGEGKSSLINAGLIPALEEKRMLPILIRFDADTEKGHLKDVDFDDFIWNEIKSIKNLTIIDNPIINPNQAIKEKLWWKLRSKDFRVMMKDSIYKPVIPVLIFDQFEEVFTKPQNLQWTYKFFKWLEELYKDEIPVNKEKNTNLDLNEHYFQKKFKALFSLRNEYVSELDYWSMERFFIPSLKNNRYYLKPLTIAAAKEVTKQLTNWPEGINEDDVIKAATDDKYKFFEENEERKTENHPQSPSCVSALILSLVLSKLEESDEFVRQKLIEMQGKENPIDNQKEFMEKLFDYIYEEALVHCGVGLKSSLRDRLEEEFIDDNGRRKRPRIEDLEKEKDLFKVIEQLKEKRFVCINNGEVELSHDCIRATVARHRTQRMNQLKEQREAAFLIPYLILMFMLIIMDAIFDKKQVTLCLILTANIFSVLHIFINGKKKCLLLSVIGSVCNLFMLIHLWHIPTDIQLHADIFKLVGIIPTFIPVVLTIILASKQKVDKASVLHKIANNLSFIIYSFSLILFAFIECVLGDFYGISLIPATSFWGVIILPPLACYITTKIIREKGNNINNSFNFQNKAIRILPHASYLCVLVLLACDTAFWHHIFLPITILLFIICVFTYYIYFYFKRTTTVKGVLCSILNFAFFLGVLIANLGYNPFEITYNSAKIVYNWSLVYTLADNGKWGVLDAWDGDTIMPCVMGEDDFKISAGYCEIKTDTCIESTWANTSSIHSPLAKTIDSLLIIINNQAPDLSYRYDHSNHVLIGRFWVYAKLERLLRNKGDIEVTKDTSIESHIGYYSAKVYKEMRQANLQYFTSGKPYTLNDIPSFYKLDSLQFCNYESVLESTLGSSRANNLTDMDFYQINRALARTFLLCAIKNKIECRDLKSLFLMTTLYSYLYFAEDATWKMNYNGQFVLSSDNLTQKTFSISGEDFKDKVYSYYYMYLQTVSMDMYSSMPNFANMSFLLERINSELLSDENFDEAKRLSMRKRNMDASQLIPKIDMSKKDDFAKTLLQSIDMFREHDKWEKEARQYAIQTKIKVDHLLAEINKFHVGDKTDDSFERINDKTSGTFMSYIARYPMSPYNMGFVRILQALCSSGFYRGYDMNEHVEKVRTLVERNIDLSYQLMECNIMMDNKEKLETMSNLLQEIIEHTQKSKSK